MSFRDFFLSELKSRTTKVTREPLKEETLQAFTKRDIETSLQVHKHLKTTGHTMDDLAAFVESKRKQEQEGSVRPALQSAIYLTREQRKHLKHKRVGKIKRGK